MGQTCFSIDKGANYQLSAWYLRAQLGHTRASGKMGCSCPIHKNKDPPGQEGQRTRMRDGTGCRHVPLPEQTKRQEPEQSLI